MPGPEEPREESEEESKWRSDDGHPRSPGAYPDDAGTDGCRGQDGEVPRQPPVQRGASRAVRKSIVPDRARARLGGATERLILRLATLRDVRHIRSERRVGRAYVRWPDGAISGSTSAIVRRRQT